MEYKMSIKEKYGLIKKKNVFISLIYKFDLNFIFLKH